MGLDTTHNAYHGPYSSFNNFRRAILKAYDNTDLFEYAGYEFRHGKDNEKPSPQIPLSDIKDEGMFILMSHSDCEGEITWQDCKTVAESLANVFDKIEKIYVNDFTEFMHGLILAHNLKEDLEFR